MWKKGQKCRTRLVVVEPLVESRYCSVTNRLVSTFISGKVCLSISIKDKRQTLPKMAKNGQRDIF